MSKGPVHIALPSYEVVVEPGALGWIASMVAPFAEKRRIAIVTDETVDQLYARRIGAQLPAARVVTIPAGETAKTRETWATITDELLANGFGRDTLILAAGGGHKTLNVGSEACDFVHYFFNYGINTIILRNRLRRS